MRERSEARAETASRRTREGGTGQTQRTRPASSSRLQGVRQRCRGAAFTPPHGSIQTWTAALCAAIQLAAPACSAQLGPNNRSHHRPLGYHLHAGLFGQCVFGFCVGVSGLRPAPSWRFAPYREALDGAGAPSWRMAAGYRNTTSLTSGRSGAEPHSSYDRDPPVNAGAERGTGGVAAE